MRDIKKLEYLIRVPALGIVERFTIPDNMEIGKCITLIREILYDEYPALPKKDQNLNLFLSNTGEVLGKTNSLQDYEILVNDILILA